VVVFAAGAASTAALPDDARLQATNLRWMWVASALATFTVGWVLWCLGKDYVRSFAARVPPALLVAATILGGVVVHGMRPGDERDAPAFRPLARLDHEVLAPLGRQVYRVQFSGGAAGTTVGPAVVAALMARGSWPLVELDDVTGQAYPADLRYHGQAAAGTILVATDPPTDPAFALLGQLSYRSNGDAAELHALERRVRAQLRARGPLRAGPGWRSSEPSGPLTQADLQAAADSPALGLFLLNGWLRADGVDPIDALRLEQSIRIGRLSNDAVLPRVPVFVTPFGGAMPMSRHHPAAVGLHAGGVARTME
jgi:hypothetical protein